MPDPVAFHPEKLADMDDTDRPARVGDLVIECASGEQLIVTLARSQRT